MSDIPQRNPAGRAPLWCLLALAAATAAYFVWRDYDDRAREARHRAGKFTWEELGERMKKAQNEETALLFLQGKITLEESQRRHKK